MTYARMRDTASTSSSGAEQPLGFVDSGIGGLPYLQWVRDRLPNARFVYVADTLNFPYGTKAPEDVLRAVVSAVDGLIRVERPRLIVIACNTASVVALTRLRELYPDIAFVGTVPAIKPAAERSVNKRFGILATQRTLTDPYLDELIARFAPDCSVIRLAGSDIVSFVEKRLFRSTEEERRAIICEAARRFRTEWVDNVVLGCTHFLYVRDELRAELGAGIELIDSTEGVGRRVLQIVALRNGGGGGRMYVTGKTAQEAQYAEFARRFSLDYAGRL